MKNKFCRGTTLILILTMTAIDCLKFIHLSSVPVLIFHRSTQAVHNQKCCETKNSQWNYPPPPHYQKLQSHCFWRYIVIAKISLRQQELFLVLARIKSTEKITKFLQKIKKKITVPFLNPCSLLFGQIKN